MEDFYPGLMENCYVDEVLYGVPYLRSTPVLYYNKTLFEKAGLDPEKGPSNWETLTTDEVNQKVAMWITSTANLSNNLQLAEDNGYEIGTAFIPKNTQNKVPTGGCNLVMTSRLEGKEKEAAALLINFMTSKDSAVKNHIKTGYLPTRQSIGSDERLITLYGETPQYKVALEQLQYGSGRPMAQAYSEMTKTY